VTMRIAAGLDGGLGLDYDELEHAALAAQRLGYDRAWTTAGSVPDPTHVCLAWARATRAASGAALPTAIGVLPALRSHEPLQLAALAASVAAGADGTFTLGIGSGGGKDAPQLAGLGMAGRPIAAMRGYLEVLRTLFAGGEIDPATAPITVAGGRLSGELRPVPIYVAALGPQMLRLGGEAADGVSLSWATPKQIIQCAALLEEGAKRAGRDRSAVTLSGYVRVCVDDDARGARRALASQFLRYGLRFGGGPLNVYRTHFDRMGFGEELDDLDARRASGATPDELADALSEEAIAQVGYYGPAAGAPEQVARLAEGLDEVVVRIITPKPDLAAVEATLEALAPERLRPALR
jgi:alkanesulfonate monooxygenase SsuD/methylene tetrahydromethanopterin reductase-like flavin-dependent oxidoreductase (luciferase family)